MEIGEIHTRNVSDSEYHFEVRRKSFEFEQNFKRPLKKVSSFEETGALENLLTDYEVVSNEELGQIDDVQQEFGKNFELFKNPKFANNLENRGKLKISLDTEKISLKSQTARIDKSILQSEAANKLRKDTRQHKRQQRVPVAFTIVPISLINKNAGYGGDGEFGNNLPEIVLTSFETRESAKTSRSKLPTTKKPATVTFQDAVATTQKQFSRALTKIPPPPISSAPEVICRRKLPISSFKNLNTKIAATMAEPAEVYEKFRDVVEDNSDINSTQPGSSTSPESLMENVLSAASSVSVRSSSLSSGGNDVAKGTAVGRVVDKNAVLIAAPNNFSHVLMASNTLTKATKTNEMQGNRAVNSKSTELRGTNSTLPLLSPPPHTMKFTLSPATTTPTTNTTVTEIVPHLGYDTLKTLKPPSATFEAGLNCSRSSSPESRITLQLTPEHFPIYPEELKCRICAEVYRDPRTLNCLHSFCFQCIVVDENFKQNSSIPFWVQPDGGGSEENDWKGTNKSNYSIRSSSPETSRSISDQTTSPLRPRRSSFSFRRKKSLEKILTKTKPEGRAGTAQSLRSINITDERARIINCKICNFATELPIGGIRQLPPNFVLVRKIEEIKLKADDEVISRVWCSLCFDETSATYHCISCMLNLCTLCKEAHERQRTTTNHKIKNIMELRKVRKLQKSNTKFMLKCGIHPSFEIKSFCSTCLQIACADCLILLHKGHKHESIGRATLNYTKILRDSAEQTRPLCNYGGHSIERLNEIAKNINLKCDEIQVEVETFMQQYFDAVEVHRKTLMNQVHRARESKVEMILEQQLDLEKHTQEAMEAVRFSQELAEVASDVEILSFVKILLKRFEFCQQFKTPANPKISDSLHFLPKIRAPATKTQNDIPLFGIITMQTVESSLCTLQWEGFSQLRLHKKVELVMLSRDADGMPLCHGGLQIDAQIKYKEFNSKFLPVEISDYRDGTYGISFTPDSTGTVLLTVTVNDKPISGNPFTFLVRSVRPHSGIFHCCAFCSSKGNKLAKCSCDGRMPGYNGCGHGHVGHPGRRHWSCCGNVLQNSECNVANMLLNS